MSTLNHVKGAKVRVFFNFELFCWKLAIKPIVGLNYQQKKKKKPIVGLINLQKLVLKLIVRFINL